jgi:hypothetical protein
VFTFLTLKELYESKFIFKPLFSNRSVSYNSIFDFSKSSNNKRISKGLKVDAGKDRRDKPISLFEGDTFYTKVATNDSDGDVFVFDDLLML